MANVWTVKRTKRDGSTAYQVRWRWKIGVKPDGEPLYASDSKTFARSGDANNFVTDKEKDLTERPHASSIDHKLTTAEFAEVYLEKYSKLEKAPKTYNDVDKPAINEFVAQYGSLPLTAIRPEHIAQHKAYLFEKPWRRGPKGEEHIGLARNSVGIRLRALKAFFRYAHDLRKIPSVPFPKKAVPDHEHTGRHLREDEITKLFEKLALAAPPVWRVCCFVLYTGLRKNEVMGLDWEHVREVKDKRRMMRVMTIQRKGGYRRTTKRKLRDVPIHPEAWQFMGDARRKGPVFPGLSDKTLGNALRRAWKAAKLGAVTLHDFRHTWATNFMLATGDLPGLMLIGGWDSLESVSVYQHLSKGRAESVFKVKYGNLAPILLPRGTAKKATKKGDHRRK